MKSNLASSVLCVNFFLFSFVIPHSMSGVWVGLSELASRANLIRFHSTDRSNGNLNVVNELYCLLEQIRINNEQSKRVSYEQFDLLILSLFQKTKQTQLVFSASQSVALPHQPNSNTHIHTIDERKDKINKSVATVHSCNYEHSATQCKCDQFHQFTQSLHQFIWLICCARVLRVTLRISYVIFFVSIVCAIEIGFAAFTKYF